METFKSQIAKNGGSIGSIIAQFAHKILKLAPAVLGNVGFAAASGAISGSTNKATGDDGAATKRKAATTRKTISGDGAATKGRTKAALFKASNVEVWARSWPACRHLSYPVRWVWWSRQGRQMIVVTRLGGWWKKTRQMPSNF